MTYKKSARIEVSGHTDNVGPAKKNKALSEKRAKACREYLISKGIDGSRIEAVTFAADGDILLAGCLDDDFWIGRLAP